MTIFAKLFKQYISYYTIIDQKHCANHPNYSIIIAINPIITILLDSNINNNNNMVKLAQLCWTIN